MSDAVGVSRETMEALHALPPATLEAVMALARWTATHAAPIGLTNFHTPQQVLAQGIAPAFALLHLDHESPGLAWAELGPGSGVLGLTLALLLPEGHVTLIDRRRRVTDYLELTIARAGIPNATALHLDPQRAPGEPQRHTVLFRALAEPRNALRMAAGLAARRIAAFHSPAIDAYQDPPSGFLRGHTRPTLTENLVLTHYHRPTT